MYGHTYRQTDKDTNTYIKQMCSSNWWTHRFTCKTCCLKSRNSSIPIYTSKKYCLCRGSEWENQLLPSNTGTTMNDNRFLVIIFMYKISYSTAYCWRICNTMIRPTCIEYMKYLQNCTLSKTAHNAAFILRFSRFSWWYFGRKFRKRNAEK